MARTQAWAKLNVLVSVCAPVVECGCVPHPQCDSLYAAPPSSLQEVWCQRTHLPIYGHMGTRPIAAFATATLSIESRKCCTKSFKAVIILKT